MTTMHDDLPHPVPDFAYLRYKENYFFVLFAPDSSAFGVIHFNHEPGFDRARYVANFEFAGRSIRYANVTPFPADGWDHSRQIGDDKLKLVFAEPHGRFEFTLKNEEVDIELVFTRRFQTFDYSACRTAGNPAPSFQEVMTLGLNAPYNHQQQALSANGKARFADGRELVISGAGYRDHSWVMRADAGVLEHDWCGLVFPSRAFGVKTIKARRQPGIAAKEGYVADASGVRALRKIEVRREGAMADGLCERVIHELEDVFGERHTIVSNVAGRYAHVPLVAEAPGKQGIYHIVENFCSLEHVQSAEVGAGLVEIGRHESAGGAFE